jgi:mersacidin/lichenicidin family type 2 lantibiotic
MQQEMVRAWKDPLYREGLTVPVTNPVGSVELSDGEIKRASGMNHAIGPVQTTAPECTLYTFRGMRACGCGF